MSVIGVDFGNESCIIGIAARGGIDIILNENSNRKNPCMVSFQDKERFMGEGALSIARSNYKNTVREVKRLVGRTWGTPELEQDLALLPYKTMQHSDTGGVGIKVNYNGEEKVFSPEQIVAMMLNKLDSIATAANADVPVADAVVSIPGWYTDSMRRSMLDACQVAGLNCLRLMNEHTATALAYGIYKSAKGLFHEQEPQHVLFLDLGHSSFSASVVTFVQGSLTVKSATYDRSLGGRDFTRAVAMKIAQDFKAKTGRDATESPKSMLKLLDAAEKTKKNLSPVGVTDTPVSIECLVDELDFSGRVSLADFEALAKPLVQRMEAPVKKALEEAGLTQEHLASVEIVGGGTRVPLVKTFLADLLGRDKSQVNFGLSCTLNADESVARGCALQCAMLSSRFKVKEFSIVEAVPYPVVFSWEGEASAPAPAEMDTANGEEEEEGDDTKAQGGNSVRIFSKNDESPKVRRVNLQRSEPFTLTASYDADAELPPGCPSHIGTFAVAVPAAEAAAKVRVNVKHDIHGILSVQSAQMMQEVQEQPAPEGATQGAEKDKKAAKGTADADGPATENGTAPMDVDDDASGSTATGEGKKTAAADSGANEQSGEDKGSAPGPEAAGEEGKAGVAAPAAEPAPKKKRTYSKVALAVDQSTASWPKARVDQAVLEEANMAQQDRILRETADKRNELESYVYTMRDKLLDSLKPMVTENAAADFSAKLQEVEDWLYSDEGFDSSKSAYAAKLGELQVVGSPIEKRLYESTHRQTAVSELTEVVEHYKKFANSSDEAYAHIEDEERNKVRESAAAAESWLFDKLGQQGSQPLTADPVITCDQIRARGQELHSTCRPIMNKPKPAPKPVEAPAAAAKEGGEEGKGSDKDGSTAEKADAAAAGAGEAEKKDKEEAAPGAAEAEGKAGEAAGGDAAAAAEPVPMDTDPVEVIE